MVVRVSTDLRSFKKSKANKNLDFNAVRIAGMFDRSMSSVIKAITCGVLGDSVIMKTEAEGDCSLEIKDAMQAGANFRKAYKKNLQIL